ncbi:MAG TPA: ribosome biogenesis GTP-binding protein YihA/YsxC [Oscillospiraceae bacterium]|nr:ribosome biogenesis GTP-binding protein YihA/YsxC [Oscillospiraceae bacterium]HPF56533.1 ribosome biogenesis GTP-binding protein YihA/YsxC [Clostridiales bacterium]HPK34184.1 ribosome biogenesis GTP-binding protein YihA/YsxC [Oscillospiraceae bacterium]HPR74913.1 ribosome biogenesis GTP-binding protein YihA/YsxC [Oscillospiraceae bacterium]
MLNFETVAFETSFGFSQQLFASDKPEIVFTGRSNVGKSSLINKLCNKKSMAKVGQTPGKTQTINFYNHPQFRLVDLPGYGYAKRAKSRKDDWGNLMEDYFQSGRDIRLAVALTDIRHEPTADDRMMIDFFVKADIPFVIAATKADKLNKTELASFHKNFPNMNSSRLIAVSALSGLGIDDLKRAIEDACGN